MAHLASFPALLFNLTPTSEYLIEKKGKTMRLEVGRAETTAPAQRSTKFSQIFKISEVFKNSKQNNQNGSKGECIFPHDMAKHFFYLIN